MSSAPSSTPSPSAAAIASFAGILLAFKDSTVVYGRYDPFQSINTVGNAVAGGVGWVLGAVFGGNLAPGGVGSIPLDWIDLGSWLITIGGVTLILIVILNPNGIASVVLNDERGIGKLRLRLRRTPPREQLVDVAPSAVTPATLEIEDLTVRFGAVVAVDGVSFRVTPREVVGLIGPNGAGKTTIVDALTGFTKPSAGRMLLNGTPMAGRSWGPARRARAGVRRSFQSLELFEEVSVAENLHAGGGAAHAFLRPARPGLAGATGAAADRGEQRPRVRARATTSTASRASFPTVGGGSSGSPARSRRHRRSCCSTSPRPGSTTRETSELGDLVRRFADQYGMAVLLIEHDVELVLRVCDRIVVVDFGRKIAEGDAGRDPERPGRHRRVPR